MKIYGNVEMSDLSEIWMMQSYEMDNKLIINQFLLAW